MSNYKKKCCYVVSTWLEGLVATVACAEDTWFKKKKKVYDVINPFSATFASNVEF